VLDFKKNMMQVELKANEKFSSSSQKFEISPGMCTISTKVIGYAGQPYTGYFGLVLFNEKNEEIARRIKWLNDFSCELKTINIRFKSLPNSRFAAIIYRINEETPFKSDCRYSITPEDELELEKQESIINEDYELPENYIMPKGTELTIEQEKTLEKNIVWIFGSPRSGTSWLALQLLSFDTLQLNEPQIGFHLGTPHPQITEDFSRYFDIFNKEPDYFFSKRYSNTWYYFLRKLILNRIQSQFQNVSKKIIIKEPNGAIGVDIILNCLPDSKIIILLRDGRDIVDSIIDSITPNGWAVKNYGLTPISEKNRIFEIEKRSKVWVKTIKLLLSQYEKHNKDQKLIVKYEDLIQHTHKILKEIYRFLEIEISEEDLDRLIKKYEFENIPSKMKGSGKVTRFAKPGKWRENFNEEEKEIMNNIMRDTLIKIGYK